MEVDFLFYLIFSFLLLQIHAHSVEKRATGLTTLPSITTHRIETLQQLRTISDIIVAAIITTAVELAISWNNLRGVNDLSTAAQLIPSVISAAYLLRSIYVWIFEPPSEQSHLVEFPYFADGSGGSGTYTNPSDGGGGGGGYPQRNMMFLGSSRDWDGRRHSPYHHHRHRHRRRRSSQMDPAMAYAAHGAMGHPDLSTAGFPYAPASAANPSRHATVVDAPDEIYAADDGATPPPAPDAAAPQVPPATASVPGSG